MRLRRLKAAVRKIRKSMLRRVNAARAKELDSPAVALVSARKWQGEVYDDLLLQRAFLDAGMKAEIVAWEDDVDYDQYDAAVVTSMWGYQHNIQGFYRWLDAMRGRTLINPAEIIRENCDKAKQAKLFDKYGLPHVKTMVVKQGELEKAFAAWEDFPVVVKPSISGSGEDTFLYRDRAELLRDLDKLNKVCAGRELILQPFMPEIRRGELSVIVIGGQIRNVVRRFPGVLEGEYKAIVEAITQLDSKLNKVCKDVMGLPEYKNALYMRVDVVKRGDEYLIMELELFEPQLFYGLARGAAQKEMLSAMVDGVRARMRQRLERK